MNSDHSRMESSSLPKGNALNVFTNGLFLGFVFASILADQLTKFLIRDSLYLGESAPVIGPLTLHYVTNTGALFGLFQGQTSILLVLSTIGVCVLLFFYAKSGEHTSGNMACMGLILGGAIGNQIDRLFLNHVTDFIAIQGYPWIFNVADAAVVVGVTGIATLTVFATPLRRPASPLSHNTSITARLWTQSNETCCYGDETWAFHIVDITSHSEPDNTGQQPDGSA